MSKVLISGASGFLALHIIGQLLDAGHSVVGTVRSQSKADKLTKQFNNPKLELVVVPDISVSGAFEDAFKQHTDINYVMHTASPFSFGGEGSLEELFRDPAVKGTLNILESIKSLAPQVSKLVITSSFAAIENAAKFADPTFIHDESVWNPMTWEGITEQGPAYVVSKKLAEEAAWEFYNQNKDLINFEINTVNPPLIFGPQYFDEDVSLDGLNTSSNIIAGALKTDPEDTSLFKKLALLSVDVRDVAKFHLLALDDKINNQRLLPISSRVTEQGVLNIINKDFPQLQGKIARGQPDKESEIVTPAYNNTQSVELVGGFQFIPLDKQVSDTVDQILRLTDYLK